MEERIVRVRDKERREKLAAAKKSLGRARKRLVPCHNCHQRWNLWKKENETQTEEEFLLPDYDSDDEIEKNGDQKDIVGGGNLAPEVLKMLQQMTPVTPTGKEEDELDEIKVLSLCLFD
jgi:hypothetical protein